jgi:hypothetical protein
VIVGRTGVLVVPPIGDPVDPLAEGADLGLEERQRVGRRPARLGVVVVRGAVPAVDIRRGSWCTGSSCSCADPRTRAARRRFVGGRQGDDGGASIVSVSTGSATTTGRPIVDVSTASPATTAGASITGSCRPGVG